MKTLDKKNNKKPSLPVPETPAKKDMGADLLIGIALGLLTTLTLFALLILAFVKIQSRRRAPPPPPGPPQQQQQPPQPQQQQQQVSILLISSLQVKFSDLIVEMADKIITRKLYIFGYLTIRVTR
jgi:heme/copper-type cytochrome/quinol oxidase subunit 3